MLLLTALLAASLPAQAQQVIMSGDYFLTHSADGYTLNAAATTEFNPNTCIWYVYDRRIRTANSSGTAYEGSSYLQRDNFSLGGSSRWGQASNGNTVYYNNYYNNYYLRLNGTTWQVNNNNSNNGYVYNVTRTTPAQNIATTYDLTAPTITPATVGLYNGENAAFSAASTVATVTATTPAHTKYAFNEREYFEYDGAVYTSTDDFSTSVATDPTSSGITYSWALSSTTYATVNGSGVVTVNSAPANDQTVTLTCTARHTASGTTKTSTVSITIYAETATPEISLFRGEQAQITCASAGATIYYTTDGTTPTASSTVYAGPFDLTSLTTTVKALAIRNGHSSSVASEVLTRTAVSPDIAISSTGEVTITCATEGATIYYTTDGSTPTTSSSTYSAPFNVANMDTVKAIAVMSGYANSEVSSQLYVTTGISGTTLVIDDREDHNWTYYSSKPDVDYPDQLRSPNPRNVKITYSGSSFGGSAAAVSATENITELVYYKTIEQKAWGESEGRWLTGDYAYRVIPNPFQKRPKVGGTYYGFAGWKIVSGGKYINGHADGDVLDLDEKINFVGLPAGNNGNGAVKFEATWTAANTVSVDGNITGDAGLPAGGTYETNFIVVSGNDRTVTGLTRAATVMGCNPDGTGATNASLSTVTGNANDLKIENINLGTGGSDFTIGTAWLIVGRGCTGNVRRVLGSTNNYQFKLRLESGLYNFVNPMGGGARNANAWGRIIFGCDYDRATNDGLTSNDQYADNSTHRKLRVINYVSFNGSGADKASNDSRDEWMDITIKSGYYGYSADYNLFSTTAADNADGFGQGIGGNTDHAVTYTAPDINGTNRTYTNLDADPNNSTYRWQRLMSFYCGRTRGGNYGGINRVLVEGGELNSINGGGYRNTGAGFGICYHFRMKGGWVKGAIYGTASSSMTNATTKQVITGGEINGWVAGACNGTDVINDDGRNEGDTYIYLGGNAELRSHRRDGVYNNAWGLVGGVEGGNIFASGRGTPATSSQTSRNYCGSSYKTYAVVADNGVVEQGVYGGGYIGLAQNSHIYITGGTTGKVFGGASTPTSTNSKWMTQNTDIRQYGGTVREGIYGGHYQGTGDAGKIHQTVSVAIYGGQVGSADAEGQRANIHGGGFGAGTSVGGDVSVTLGKCDTIAGATVYGDVYGGSALGSVNASSSNNTIVSLRKGIIYGGLYGGGLGDSVSLGAGHSNVAAVVNGRVQVVVTGGSVKCSLLDPKGEAGSGSVFGCNNINGTPKSTVNVDIYHTDMPANSEEYALYAVYGGGNKASYTGTPKVTIHGCSNSIEYVYGGGNAADVSGTNVTIWGGNIGNAYGGGNGFSAANPPNHDNPAGEHYNPGAKIKSDGTHLTIHGGTITSVYGGSNQYGTINGGINVLVSEATESGTDDCGRAYTSCPTTNITELYGGGNEALAQASDDSWISPTVTVSSCDAEIENLFGGAKKANHGANINLEVTNGKFHNVFGGNNIDGIISGNITLTIKGGTMTNVFGGNNQGGNVLGTITIVVDSTGNACPLKVDNVYGGGNMAVYTPTDPTGNTPEVNVLNGTVRNAVYGGGLGDAAAVTANPTVTIGGTGTKQAIVGGRLIDDSADGEGNVYGGGSQADVLKGGDNTGNTHVILTGKATVKGNVYGGGNQANVEGNTKVEMK